MSLDIFKSILLNVDKDTQIHFSGFSEPFLTDKSEEMMLYAYDMGYQVVLFSTLVGFNEHKANKIKDIKFEYVRIHEFDSKYFNKEYFYKNVELLRNAIGNFEVSVVNNPSSRGGNNWSIKREDRDITCSRVECNVVLPNGDLYLCCSDWSLKHYLGNLLNDKHNSDVIVSNRNNIYKLCKDNKSDVLCRTCEWSHIL